MWWNCKLTNQEAQNVIFNKTLFLRSLQYHKTLKIHLKTLGNISKSKTVYWQTDAVAASTSLYIYSFLQTILLANVSRKSALCNLRIFSQKKKKKEKLLHTLGKQTDKFLLKIYFDLSFRPSTYIFYMKYILERSDDQKNGRFWTTTCTNRNRRPRSDTHGNPVSSIFLDREIRRKKNICARYNLYIISRLNHSEEVTSIRSLIREHGID